jgi:hypothetical protein
MANPLPLGKSFYFMVNLYLLAKPFYFYFWAKAFTSWSTSISWQNLSISWLNFYLLTKPSTSCLNLYLLAKHLYFMAKPPW